MHLMILALSQPHTGFIDSPTSRLFLLNFLAYIPAVVLVLTLSLTRVSLSILTPLLGLLYQTLSAGLVFPILGAIGVNLPTPTGSPGRSLQGKLTDVDVEGILLGILIGIVWPTYLIAWETTQMTLLLWQAFPLYAWAIQFAYTRVMTYGVGRKGRDPTFALNASYTIIAVLSLAAHLPVIVRLTDSTGLKTN